MSSDSQPAGTPPLEVIAEAAFSSNKGLYLGPYLVGCFIDLVLCGVMIVQFSHWVSYGSDDKRTTKINVIALFIISLANSVVMMAFNKRNYVYNFGTYAQFAETDWQPAFFAIDGVVAVLVQAFFAERSYRYTKNNKIFLVVLSLMIALGFGGCIAVTVASKRMGVIFELDTIRVHFYCWLSGQVAADLTITSTIMYGLIQSRTGWTNTDQLIRRLVVLSAQTQLPPTVVALVFLIYYALNPLSVVNGAFTLVMSKFYVCGLLLALNSRFGLRRAMDSQGPQVNAYGSGRTDGPSQATVQFSTTPVDIELQSKRTYGHANHGGRYSEEDNMDESSARKLDYADNSSRTVLTV